MESRSQEPEAGSQKIEVRGQNQPPARHSDFCLLPPGFCLVSPVVKLKLMSELVPDETPREDVEIPLPPASFSFLVLSLRTQTELQLGLLRYSQEDKAEPNLPLARHSIDLMSVLLEKTKGNLSMEEHRLLENSLTELRFRFVQVQDDVAKAAAQKA